ncbi:MAG: AAA family ATPase [candidate division WOR-3 bacterium]|nr:MAG: AAA family ATPase [candidate division WOR-3 bacterium]
MRRYLSARSSTQRNAVHIENGVEEKPFDFHEIISKFFRRKRLFIYFSIPVFLWLAIGQILKPYRPVYRATFDVGVVRDAPLESFFSGTRVADLPTTQIGAVTQRAIASLLSVNLAEKVVNDLSLFAYIDGIDSDLMVDAILKQRLVEPVGPLKIRIDNVPVSIYKDGKQTVDSIYGLVSIYKNGTKIAEGPIDEYIDIGVGNVRFMNAGVKTTPKNLTLTLYPKQNMSLALRNSLSIRVLEADKIEQEFENTDIPFSGEGASDHLVVAKSIFPGMNLIGILRIAVHWGNPRDALRIANTLSYQLLMEDRGEKSLQFTQSKAFLDSQLTLYQGSLNKLEEEVRTFKERKNIADLKASTQALISQVSELETRKNQLQIEQNVLGGLIAYLAKPESVGDSIPNFAITMLSSDMLRDFYSDLLQAEAELRGRLKEYSTNHPKIMEIRARLGGLKEQLNEEVLKRMSSVRTEISSYNSQIASLQAKLDNVPLEELSLARLERDRETAEKLYNLFSEKLEETRVQEAGVTSDLKIVNPPILADSPVNSRGILRGLILALVVASLVGTAAVFGADYVDNSIRDPEKITKKLQIPLLETIPLLEDEPPVSELESILTEIGVLPLYRRLTKKEKPKPPREPLRLVNTEQLSPEFEAFRKLAVGLDLIHPYKKYRVLYITSPGPEEGKTFIALNLGHVIASMGKSVLLIDTDFRKKSGHLTEVTKLKKELGVFDILMGSVEPQDVVLKLNPGDKDKSKFKSKGRVDLLPMGKVPPNPFVFLESDSMKKLLGTLRNEYDYLLIDGVPLLLFADATYLATFADGVLLTARYGRTTMKSLEVSHGLLLNAKSDVLGTVVNGVPRRRGSYYYDQYYKYYSKYYRKEHA